MKPARSATRSGIPGIHGALAPLAVVLFVLACAGCGRAAGTTSTTTEQAEPTGHTYLSTEVTEAGTPRTLAPGTRIRLEFTEDDRLAVDAGCSSMGGSVALKDDRLAVGEIAGTDIGCDAPRHAQDQWLTSFLAAEPAWQVSGHRLVLTADRPHQGTRIVLLDRKVADPDRPLLGTRWDVTTLVDGDTASTIARSADAEMVFSENEMRGSDGCNGMGGPVTHTSTHLTFGMIFTHVAKCIDLDRDRTEVHVLAIVQSGEPVAYHIDGDQLTLDGPDGKGLVLTAHRASR
ncbi:META domain-containing protein [Actinopolymorpha sp. NPDC004070]|uniref:META domain-containing protein n=1 Tax=Actinopolymorpha sp. NPDC004070 TaxID=3154548 RepID=UPI0033B38075